VDRGVSESCISISLLLPTASQTSHLQPSTFSHVTTRKLIPISRNLSLTPQVSKDALPCFTNPEESSHKMTTSLPTPRQLLTSLLKTLSSTPLPLPTQAQIQINPIYGNTNDTPANPLKSLPPSARALLTTLHVLFPPPMLLQALDLLDRGLVTRLIKRPPPNPSVSQDEEGGELEGVVMPPQVHIHLRPSPTIQELTAQTPQEPETEDKKRGRHTVYLVRSSQPPKSRFRESGDASLVYTVHLQSWNCSCAAFAFGAYPHSYPSTHSNPWELSGEDEGWDVEMPDFMEGEGEKEGEEKEWEFGGLSFDGLQEESVPVCKHLLACLLGERWEAVLGPYVKERIAGVDEMAGLAAE